jgi:hypothetical protein
MLVCLYHRDKWLSKRLKTDAFDNNKCVKMMCLIVCVKMCLITLHAQAAAFVDDMLMSPRAPTTAAPDTAAATTSSTVASVAAMPVASGAGDATPMSAAGTHACCACARHRT